VADIHTYLPRQLEQDFEIATQEYDQINAALKQDLPQFMVMATQFIDPLFHSFYYMQYVREPESEGGVLRCIYRLNIYYLMMEKLQGFVQENKFSPGASGAEILGDYENERTEAWQQVESLHITKRIASTGTCTCSLGTRSLLNSPAGKMIQARRQETGLSPGSGLSRSATTSSASSGFKKAPPPPPPGNKKGSTFNKKPPPPPPNGSSSVAFKKAPPPPPPSSAVAPPPPYTPGNGPASAFAAAAKRAAPPPPATKPKPTPAPKPVYVVAMFDFTAQVRSARCWQLWVLTGTQADGDLDFKTGDMIEVVSRTENQEDWWTGKLDGRQGVFPGA
jgi:amphiphysin